MNVRKPVDYSAMFSALDALMATDMTQMELYREIGRLVSGRQGKGAAVAAAEYLCGIYPNASGFSPRNVRRMRDFYRTYESDPEVLAEAMTIGWTQNVVILEADLTGQERAWYIKAANQFKWSKLELQKRISANAHMEIFLDNINAVCYAEEKVEAEKVSGHVTAQDSQCHRTGSFGSTDELPAVLCLLCSQVLNRGIRSQSLPVCGGSGWPMGIADGSGAQGRRGLQQALLQESEAGQPGVVSRPRKLPAQWVRLRFPLRGRAGKLPGEMYHRHTAPGGADSVQGPEAADWLWQQWTEGLRYRDDQSANADLCYSS